MDTIERQARGTGARQGRWTAFIREIAVQGGGADVICEYLTRVGRRSAEGLNPRERTVEQPRLDEKQGTATRRAR